MGKQLNHTPFSATGGSAVFVRAAIAGRVRAVLRENTHHDSYFTGNAGALRQDRKPAAGQFRRIRHRLERQYAGRERGADRSPDAPPDAAQTALRHDRLCLSAGQHSGAKYRRKPAKRVRVSTGRGLVQLRVQDRSAELSAGVRAQYSRLGRRGCARRPSGKTARDARHLQRARCQSAAGSHRNHQLQHLHSVHAGTGKRADGRGINGGHGSRKRTIISTAARSSAW